MLRLRPFSLLVCSLLIAAGSAGLCYNNYKTSRLLELSEKQNVALEEECYALRQYIAEQLKPVIVHSDAAEASREELTLAHLNNNPLNIKGSNWLGQVGQDKFGHAIFASPDYGFRAAARLLLNYKAKHGIKTIDALVERFCTGNKQSYKQFLSSHLNVQPTDEIDIQDRLPELLRAMARFESGQWYEEELFLPYSVLSSR